MEKHSGLPRTIVYSVDPTCNAAISSMLGCFQDLRGRISQGNARLCMVVQRYSRRHGSPDETARQTSARSANSTECSPTRAASPHIPATNISGAYSATLSANGSRTDFTPLTRKLWLPSYVTSATTTQRTSSVLKSTELSY